MEDTSLAEESTTTHSVPLEPSNDNQSLQPQDPPIEEESQEKHPSATDRRRGRRKVMKKKTTRDAEGYLVTKEEAEWESFSEEEAPQPPPAKKTKAPVVSYCRLDGCSRDWSKGEEGDGGARKYYELLWEEVDDQRGLELTGPCLTEDYDLVHVRSKKADSKMV